MFTVLMTAGFALCAVVAFKMVMGFRDAWNALPEKATPINPIDFVPGTAEDAGTEDVSTEDHDPHVWWNPVRGNTMMGTFEMTSNSLFNDD